MARRLRFGLQLDEQSLADLFHMTPIRWLAGARGRQRDDTASHDTAGHDTAAHDTLAEVTVDVWVSSSIKWSSGG